MSKSLVSISTKEIMNEIKELKNLGKTLKSCDAQTYSKIITEFKNQYDFDWEGFYSVLDPIIHKYLG